MIDLFIIKVGGNVIDNPVLLQSFLEKFATIPGKKILIHGGGKIATRIGDKLGIESKYVDGRRITDADTIDVVTMVYGGLVNKQLVAKLQANHCNAIGLTGADANIASIFTGSKARLTDVTLNVLSSLTLADLEEAGAKNLIREKLVNAYNQALRLELVGGDRHALLAQRRHVGLQRPGRLLLPPVGGDHVEAPPRHPQRQRASHAPRSTRDHAHRPVHPWLLPIA